MTEVTLRLFKSFSVSGPPAQRSQQMSPLFFRFLIYGCLGWCGEIIFTAITSRALGQTRNWLLMGETSLWYFPMYGSIAFLYEPLHDFFARSSF